MRKDLLYNAIKVVTHYCMEYTRYVIVIMWITDTMRCTPARPIDTNQLAEDHAGTQRPKNNKNKERKSDEEIVKIKGTPLTIVTKESSRRTLNKNNVIMENGNNSSKKTEIACSIPTEVQTNIFSLSLNAEQNQHVEQHQLMNSSLLEGGEELDQLSHASSNRSHEKEEKQEEYKTLLLEEHREDIDEDPEGKNNTIVSSHSFALINTPSRQAPSTLKRSLGAPSIFFNLTLPSLYSETDLGNSRLISDKKGVTAYYGKDPKYVNQYTAITTKGTPLSSYLTHLEESLDNSKSLYVRYLFPKGDIEEKITLTLTLIQRDHHHNEIHPTSEIQIEMITND